MCACHVWQAADERAKVEQLLEQLGGEQADTNRKTKEADERAVEFEKQWVAESKLRKELHNQLEELVGNLRVYCRVRPQIEREAESEICVTVKGSDQVIIKDLDDDRRDKKHFMFTQARRLLSPYAPQQGSRSPRPLPAGGRPC